jgi:hypothetical protein
MLRRLFESVVQRCIAEGLVSADGFAVDASLIAADANKQRSVPSREWKPEEIKETATRATQEYLATLDNAAFGGASTVTPKFISRSDPAAQWTGAHKGHAFFAYANNYLIDTDHGVIVDVEATRAIRQAEVGAARTMLERTETRFGIKPAFLAADSAYGSAKSLAWLVKRKEIAPHIPVFDKSNRTDGTFSRADFAFDAERDRYICPAGKELVQFRRTYSTPRSGITAEGRGFIAPANWIATSANLKLSAARTLLPERSRGIWTKMLAMWPVRTPQLRNTWKPVAAGRKSRCCSPISSGYCASRACVSEVRTGQEMSSCSRRSLKI